MGDFLWDLPAVGTGRDRNPNKLALNVSRVLWDKETGGVLLYSPEPGVDTALLESRGLGELLWKAPRVAKKVVT